MKKSLIIVPSLLMMGMLSATVSPVSAASRLDSTSNVSSAEHIVTVTTSKTPQKQGSQTGVKAVKKGANTTKNHTNKTGVKAVKKGANTTKKHVHKTGVKTATMAGVQTSNQQANQTGQGTGNTTGVNSSKNHIHKTGVKTNTKGVKTGKKHTHKTGLKTHKKVVKAGKTAN